MSANNPLISIILLCYNQEQFVAEAVDGVLGQSYRPLEIVIFDDCSSDGTADVIASRLAISLPRSDVRFIRNSSNMTWPACYRRGLDITEGSFVVISCGDDVMLPEMVSEVAKVWLQQSVSLVTTNALYIDSHSSSLDRFHLALDAVPDTSFETLARDGANTCCFGASMGFERDLYTRYGWPHDVLGAEDIMFPFYAYLEKGVQFISRPLLKYRVHSANTSLSLIAEKSDLRGQLTAHERAFNGHMAHAVMMQDMLTRLSVEQPNRYSELEKRISPLLTIQTVEMAKKLVRTRIKLYELDHPSPTV
jgi:glycosyltransferase involved in cell wall biosynthesis